jgi:hypothetical protein
MIVSLSDSQFISIITAIIVGIVTIIGSSVGLAYRIGKKSGEIQEKLNSLTNKVNEENERLTYIERLFMNNTPNYAEDLLKRFFPTKGEKQQ